MPDGPTRKRGRPRLPPDRRPVSVTLWLRPKDFDRVCRLALEQATSMNAVIKRGLRNGFRCDDGFVD